MDKQELNTLLSAIVVGLIIIAIIIILHIGSVIKTEGGKCTANPRAYTELKLLEQTGKRHECSCVLPHTLPTNKVNFSLDYP